MKIQITRKFLTATYRRIYAAGYCELYPLYRESAAKYYAAGVYGWNYDVYPMPGNIAITSGYRGMIGTDIPATAQKILDNAKKYCKTQKDYKKQDQYLQRARRAFEKALQEG